MKGAAFLGAVPLIANGRRHGARPEGAGSPSRLPALSRSVLGQTGTRCYQCGYQGYRWMTPQMASMVPGGCIEADPSKCPPPATTPMSPTGPSISPTSGGVLPASPSWTDGPTRIEITVYEPYELKPYAGAQVMVELYKFRVAGAWQYSEIVRGTTDQNGKFVWNGSAPAPMADYHFRVSLLSPIRAGIQTADVPARDATSMAAGNHQLSISAVEFAACPPGSNSLVCAVAEAQISWKTIYEQQLKAWHYNILPETPYIPSGEATIAARMAAVNVALRDPILVKYRFPFSWWVGDRTIPPKDWPDLIAWYEQTMDVFGKIPFPRYSGAEDYFSGCCATIPIAQDRTSYNRAINDPRLYSKTWCAFFPKESRLIEVTMAASYFPAFPSIIVCMVQRFQRELREAQKTMALMSALSLGLTMGFMPLFIAAGPGGIAALGTTISDIITSSNLNLEGAVEGLGWSFAVTALAAGDVGLIMDAMKPTLDALIQNLDPAVQQLVRGSLEGIVKQASHLITDTLGVNMGLPNIALLGQVAGPIFVTTIKMLVMLPMVMANKQAERIARAAVGIQQMSDDIQALREGRLVSPELSAWLEWAISTPVQYAIDQALDQLNEELNRAAQEAANNGGSVDVVLDENGLPAFVPTNPQGVPTDAKGTPLPNGVPPGKPIESPPAPVETVIGAGGAVALLLAVTGVLS